MNIKQFISEEKASQNGRPFRSLEKFRHGAARRAMFFPFPSERKRHFNTGGKMGRGKSKGQSLCQKKNLKKRGKLPRRPSA